VTHATLWRAASLQFPDRALRFTYEKLLLTATGLIAFSIPAMAQNTEVRVIGLEARKGYFKSNLLVLVESITSIRLTIRVNSSRLHYNWRSQAHTCLCGIRKGGCHAIFSKIG
jgi:hypothetical protein